MKIFKRSLSSLYSASNLLKLSLKLFNIILISEGCDNTASNSFFALLDCAGNEWSIPAQLRFNCLNWDIQPDSADIHKVAFFVSEGSHKDFIFFINLFIFHFLKGLISCLTICENDNGFAGITIPFNSNFLPQIAEFFENVLN